MKYQLISYDVWGNDKDGYEVNQAFTTGDYAELADDITDVEIVKALQEQGFINDCIIPESVEISGELGYSLYFDYAGKPEFELRAD